MAVDFFEEMLRLMAEQEKHPRRKNQQEEHKIQEACVKWFKVSYPDIGDLLHAIPNGGLRNKGVAVTLKKEGMRAGVPDLCLPIVVNGRGVLYLELKTEKGRLRDSQKKWMSLASQHGNICVVVRSLDDFIFCVTHYLSGDFDALNPYLYGQP